MASTIVLITGANSGVGLATTKVLVEASKAFHVIMAGRSLDKVEAAKSELEKELSGSGVDARNSISALQLDVTDSDSILRAAQKVESQYGRLDALLNNAGVGSMDNDVKTRMKLCMDTNVLGPALVSAAFRPLLLKSSNPYSIYVSSGAGSLTRAATPSSTTGYVAMPNEEAYRASKAALNMIAIVEARDYAAQGLKVFAMCPGFVVSNLRGTGQEARSGGGAAGSPELSGNLVLSILQGKRNEDVGKFVHREGIYPW